MAATLLSSFSIVMFGFYDGHFGENCNTDYSESCEGVFRSRTTCFTVMMWAFAVFAWELVDFRRSFFDGIRTNPQHWFHRLWSNQFLFWSILASFFSTFLTIYIPVVNTEVFLHAPIDKEWGIVISIIVFFFIGAETWKGLKRAYFRKKGAREGCSSVSMETDLEKDTAIGQQRGLKFV